MYDIHFVILRKLPHLHYQFFSKARQEKILAKFGGWLPFEIT